MFLRTAAAAILASAAIRGAAQQQPAGLAIPQTARAADAVRLPALRDVKMEGLLGTRIDRNATNRLLEVDEGELLAGFRHRPGKQAWIGEHVGKWLHAASLAWAYTGDSRLRAKLDRVVTELLKTQEPSGYLGTYVSEKRWGLYPDADWDVWVHKYNLLGLLSYYQFTGNRRALAGARRIGNLLVATFGPGKKSILSAGTHVGMAATSVMEPMVLLYRATGEPRYLAFAKYLTQAWEEPNGPKIISTLLATHSVRRTANAKAYEMLSNLNGLCELYRATGDRQYLTPALIAWDDIVKNRLYVTGSGSSFEHWQDDGKLPTGSGANICETCVTVTWEQLNVQLLRLTGEARFAEQLERSVYNHLLGAQKPTGDDWCYYTPLEGRKPYDKGTNCCHSSGPRGVALVPEFAYMLTPSSVAVNLYGSSQIRASVGGGAVTIRQRSSYPLGEQVEIRVDTGGRNRRFALLLRVPSEPAGLANLTVNGTMLKVSPKPGAYLPLERDWRTGDRVTFRVVEPVRRLKGAADTAGHEAVMYGPLALALDASLNPELQPIQRALIAPGEIRGPGPDGVFEAPGEFVTPGSAERRLVTLNLTPFYAAGQSGSRYTVWIPTARSPVRTGASLFFLGEESRSREGNQGGEIMDDDLTTFRVTFDGTRKEEDWFAVSLPKPVTINRVVYAHGRSFHDGGWFDTTAGKPRIQVRRTPGGPWEDAGSLDSYPDCTAAKPGPGLRDGATFTLRFAPRNACAIRIVGRPASGDRPDQAFSSCAELQAFHDQ